MSNASSLVKNSTSNLAECFMGIRCKFDGGKVLNRIQRGSFQHRCNGAGLRFQLGPDWTSRVWHSVTGQEPGEVMRAYCAKSTLDHQKDMKRKGESKYKEARKKARYTCQANDYSETYPCDHLYSETSIERLLGHVPSLVIPSLLRDHLYSKTTFSWPRHCHLTQVSL